jgi:hypothetical protein
MNYLSTISPTFSQPLAYVYLNTTYLTSQENVIREGRSVIYIKRANTIIINPTPHNTAFIGAIKLAAFPTKKLTNQPRIAYHVDLCLAHIPR